MVIKETGNITTKIIKTDINKSTSNFFNTFILSFILIIVGKKTCTNIVINTPIITVEEKKYAWYIPTLLVPKK